MKGGSTLYENYTRFCPRTEFDIIFFTDYHSYECSICEIFIHSSISVVKFKYF